MDHTPNYHDFIEVNPVIRFGKPVIMGTRITVYEVLGWLAAGQKTEDIFRDFPQLKEDHIQACLSYASDKDRTITILQ